MGGTIDGLWSCVTGISYGGYKADPRDCCSYALKTLAGTIMFDAGADATPGELTHALKVRGLVEGPAMLFLTHAHADHSGGANFLRDTYNCRVLAGRQTSEWLSKPNERLISLDLAKRVGLYAHDYPEPQCTVDQELDDGTVTEFGGAMIKAISTPGHSADHFSYLVTFEGRTTLVAGDAIFANGTVLLQDTWDCSVSQTCESIRRIAETKFELLLPGHGEVLAESGFEAVQVALTRIGRALPPQNLV